MHNVQMKVVDDELIIVCGLTPAAAPARPDILASTGTFVSPDGRPDLRVSLMVFTRGDAALTQRFGPVVARPRP